MLDRILPAFKKIFSRSPSSPSVPRRKKTARKLSQTMSREKQAKLDLLCTQLLSRKSLITSGKLQFVGLSKIKRHLGKEWAGLSKIVYGAVEEVFAATLDASDIFIRYHDEAYVLLFAHATKAQAEEKVAIISEEIRKRLFAVEEKKLREMEIRNAISEIKASSIRDGSFTDFLDAFAMDIDMQDAPPQDGQGGDEGVAAASMQLTEIDTAVYQKEPKQKRDAVMPSGVVYSYLPLWDVRRNALTTYLCLSHLPGKDVQASYKELYKNQSQENSAVLDIGILKTVTAELADMVKNGRQLLIACPVQNETLHSFESYEEYKALLEAIPEAHRQYLILLVLMNANDQAPVKDPYWFATPLRVFCRHVFAEVPLRRDLNFNYLRNSGVDIAGIRLEGVVLPEQEIINILNNFSSKATTFKIPQTFVLGVSTLSITTSAVCSGFSYLGGPAIHEHVAHPDIVHRYRHEDLLSHLIPTQ